MASELAELVTKRLIQRRDVFAIQRAGGGYRPSIKRNRQGDIIESTPLTYEAVELHLSGEATLGHYLIAPPDRCRMVGFDIDLDKEVQWGDEVLKTSDVIMTDHPASAQLIAEVRCHADAIAFRLKRKHPHATVITTFTGSKGAHVYGAFGKAVLAGDALTTAQQILESIGMEVFSGKVFYRNKFRPEAPIAVEVFPKQSEVDADGFGNLMRMPLGTHLKTGRSGFAYDPRSNHYTLRPVDPIKAFTDGTL